MGHINEPRTQAERLLAGYFGARGWLCGPDWQYEPELAGRRRRPDFRLRLGGWQLMLEVKEFGRAESAPDGPRRGRHARIAAKIHLAGKQMREFRRDHICAAVLRSGEDADADVSDPAAMMGALVGDPTFVHHRRAGGLVPVWRRRDGSEVSAVIALSEVHGAAAVTIIEHPLATESFPSHLFQGPWDAHWAVRDDGLSRVFAGANRRAVEVSQVAHSAA